jgi:hypothetical protein
MEDVHLFVERNDTPLAVMLTFRFWILTVDETLQEATAIPPLPPDGFTDNFTVTGVFEVLSRTPPCGELERATLGGIKNVNAIKSMTTPLKNLVLYIAFSFFYKTH